MGSEFGGAAEGVDFLFYTPYTMILPMHPRNDDKRRDKKKEILFVVGGQHLYYDDY